MGLIIDKYKGTGYTFADYANAMNKRILKQALGISLIFEVLYFLIDRVFFNHSVAPAYSVEIIYRQMQPFFALVFGLAFFIVAYYFDRRPVAAGSFGVSIILFQKVYVYLAIGDAVLMLVLWAIVTIILSLFYMNSRVFVASACASYLFLLAGVFYKGIFVGSGAFLWVDLVVLSLAIYINIRNNLRENERYNLMQQLLIDKESSEFLLNNDTLTTLKTKYALEKKISDMKGQRSEEDYLLVFDLDDVNVCNSLYGRELGDEYLKVFSRIILFLKKNDHDIVARSGPNEFIAYVSGYSTRAEIEDKL